MPPQTTEDQLNGPASPIEPEPVAVVGLSLRFPEDATSPGKFWDMLQAGRSVMSEVPPDRFNIDGFYHPDASRNDTINCRGGHFLKDNVAAFDAPFFSMNPSEVDCLDPQQRALLETSFQAFENAGIPVETVVGSNTSVYVGALGAEYARAFEFDEEVHATYKATGNSGAILSNRLSWFYDLTGPSMTIETACSSSLIALHLACQSLRCKESHTSMVCGSQLYLEPSTSAISLSSLKFMSPSSLCRSFDESGDGYAKGEGFAVLLLKRLSDAVRDNDVIRAVIRATGTNQDGRTPGISQPSQKAQEALIRGTYRSGGLDMKSTRLFEAHGPGTPLGDPLEAAAIRSVFQEYRSPDDPMHIGALKANIGHLEANAGLAGVIKTIFCLEKGIIPPIAGLEKVNSRIPAEEWNIHFPTKSVPWPTTGLRRASVNAFGYGGSNAHAVLDDAYNYLCERGITGHHATSKEPPKLLESSTPDQTASQAHITNGHTNVQSNGVTKGPSNGVANGITNGLSNGISNGVANDAPKTTPLLFVWSAADAGGIQRVGSAYEQFFLDLTTSGVSLEYLHDLAHTLSNRRSVLPWKSYVLAESLEDLLLKVQHIPKPLRSSTAPKLQFIFTGQGAQWARMGVELLGHTVFSDSLRDADVHMKSLGSSWSLVEELEKPAELSEIDGPALSQPLCTALQVALVELLSTWGVAPWGVAGHSSGEIAAAFCTGAISRESAWTIAYFRGALAARIAATSERQSRGAMMAVGLSDSALQPYFSHIAMTHGQQSLSVGCVNSANNITVTGLEEAIDSLKTQLDEEGVFARKLKIPVAYHSSHMQVVAEEYKDLLQPISPPYGHRFEKSARPVFVSSVTGRPTAPEDLCRPEYWVKNLVSTVRFSEAVEQLASSSSGDEQSIKRRLTDRYIEIGPHAALQRAVKDSAPQSDNFKYDSTLRRDTSALWTLGQLSGELWLEGYPVKIEAVNNSYKFLNRSPRMVTDLPEYPFNHSQTYWLESRLFRNYRLRNHIRHELMGIPCNDWNPLEPKFRFTIRVSDLPWLTDHRLNGSPVYPAAGMVVMAVEAARYLARPGFTIKGFRLREVTVFAALVVPETPEGVECQIYMRNQKNSRTTGIKSIDCREFRVCVYSDNEWRDVCAGSITTEYKEGSADEVYCGDDESLTQEHYFALYQRALERCSEKTTQDVFYEAGREIGYEFGPLFNTLHDMSYDPNGDQAIAIISPDEWRTKLPVKDVQPHVIHPTTLDGVLQVAAVANTKGGTIIGPLQAPTQLRSLWISHDLLSRTPSTKLEVLAETTLKASRETDSSIIALNTDSGEPAVVADGYCVTTVSSLQYTPSKKRDIFYRLDWKPDVDLLDRSQKEQYCLRKEGMSKEWKPSKDVVCLYYMSVMLKELDAQGYSSPTPHFQKYVKWVRYHLDNMGGDNPLLQTEWAEIFGDDSRRKQYLTEFAAAGPVERALNTFCQQLANIIRGEVDPIDLLFNHHIAKDLYSDETFGVTANRIAAFVDILAHKKPGIDILEIGAGTGSGTEPILSTLSQQDGGSVVGTPRYSTFVFTDISPSFFEKAKVQFADHANRMRFQTLDIERDPAEQGFEVGKYDLVVAANVLHATECVSDTLKHARSLLKPGGYLALMEPTNKNGTVLNGVWGTLAGWWRSKEEDRYWGPLYSQSEWDHYLKQSGFSGLELAVSDFRDMEHHSHSFLLSRATSEGNSQEPQVPESLLIVAETEFQRNVAQGIASSFEAKGSSPCDIVSPQAMLHQDTKHAACVSLLEVERPFLATMTEEQFAAFNKVVNSSNRVYWITSGASERARIPENAMSSGFSRAIMLEHPGLHMANVNVGNVEKAAKTVVGVVERSFAVTELDDREDDYSEKDGEVLIPRVAQANDVNDFVHSQTAKRELEERYVGKQPTEALEIQFSPGQLDSFRFGRDETHAKPLEGHDVEVEVKATGINFADVMCVLGNVAKTHIGHEYSGVVRRVGSEVTHLTPGDRVCGLASGTAFKTFVRNQAHTIICIPDHLPFAEAFPAVFLTALYGIVHLGRVGQGDSVLIHSAAGAVGQAAIQLAQQAGADVFVTVSSTAKKDLLKEHYGIPDNRFFSSRRLSFGKQLLRATNGRGVDVILNSTSGEMLAETWRCIAPLGRFVEIGKRDIDSFQSLDMYQFAKNVTFSSLDLQMVYRNHPILISKLMAELRDILFARKLQAPRPVTQFSRGKLESAFRYLQTGRHMGKAVINWEEEAEISVIPSSDPDYFFDSQASYVIAGGLGGIGRSFAKWFAGRGARNLILLSRSGAVSEESIKLVKELTERGVNVKTPRCDVGNAEMLKAVLNECAKTMPPVKGVVQASMVLRDRLFDIMTKEEWQAVLDPKISGTWNLHNELPRNMDFFVILSSLGGMIGSRGQSQYNAAATFQDAFARHRWSLGEKCVSVDVGLVLSVGYVAEQEEGVKRWSNAGLEVLREEELHSVVDWACNPTRNLSSAWETQILTAVDRPAATLEQGKKLFPYMKRPLYRALHQNDGSVTGDVSQSTEERVDYGALLGAATSVEEAGTIIATALARRLSRALSVPEEDVDMNKPAHTFGVDSLVAVELRFWFANEIKAELSVFNILANSTILELGQLAASKCQYLQQKA